MKSISKGKISFILALLQIAYIIVMTIIDISGNWGYATLKYLRIEFIIRTTVAFIALVLGVIALFQKEKNKRIIIIGLMINSFISIGPFLDALL